MRGKVACIVLSLAAVGVLGGSLYTEKEDAVKVVENRFEEFKNFLKNVVKHVEDERNKKEKELENQINQTADKARSETLTKFAAEVSAATRTAIAKGKPLSVVDCITKVAFEGHDAILKVEQNVQSELQAIKSRKQNALDMALYQINIIGTAATQLKDESLKKIKEAKDGFQALQADALKKLDAAKKQIEQVEARIPKPDIKSEFVALRQQIEPKFQEVLASQVKKLQKC